MKLFIDMYETGNYSLNKLSETFGFGRKFLSKLLKRRGIKVHLKPHPKNEITRFCNGWCKKLLPIENFNFKKSKGIFIGNKCKECIKKHRKIRVEEQALTIIEKHCSCCLQIKLLEDFRKSCRGFAARGSKCRVCIKSTETKKKNEQRKERYHNKNKYDLKFMMNLRLSGRIRSALKNGGKKCAKTVELIGCSMGELRSYIESKFQPGMTWDNWGKGNGNWNIDHILPCCSFDLSKPEEQYKCFHFTNLRPLWFIDNIQKLHYNDKQLSIHKN